MSVEIQRHLAEILRRHRRGNNGCPLRIRVNPGVLDRLRSEDETLLVELEHKFDAHLTFVADGNLHIEDFVITNAETDNELYSSIES
jgi:ribonuclease G